uniref:Uncharacterized protein n=1 Tax=Dulem virus 57 TaxID=3145768 RepID=A0AAU8B551_9VIRU
MRLGVYLRFSRLILLAFLCSVSFFGHAAAIWSDVGYFYNSSEFNKDGADNTQGYDLSKCNVSSFFGAKEDGDKDASREHVRVDQDENGLKIHYGGKGGYFGYDSRWNYAQYFEFNVPPAFKNTLLSALKKALSSGNCTLANELTNQLKNGTPQECDGDKCLTFEDANGSTCTVTSSGGSYCKWDGGSSYGETEDGTPRITISPRDGSLDDYAGVKDVDKLTDDNSGQPGGSDKSGGINEHSGSAGDSGQGSSNSGNGTGGGTGKVDGNTSGSKGAGSAGGGDGTGGKGKEGGNGTGEKGDGESDKGDGKGSGKGKGDGNSDKDKDKGETQVDLSAPTMNQFFAGLRKTLKDKFLSDFDITGGECPKPTITLLHRSYTISQHCTVLESVRDHFAALMMFLYTFAAMRVILSS